MKRIFSIAIFYFIVLFSVNAQVKTGIWRAAILNVGGQIPFGLDIQQYKEDYRVVAINGKERLLMDNSFIKNDSLHIPMDMFDAEIIAKVSGDKMTGIFKKKRSDLSLLTAPFMAEFGKTYRFAEPSNEAKQNVTGKWAVTFGTDKPKKVVGVFEQKGNVITGTFLTPTGDYRYLDGNMIGDSLFLSAFDGSHVFLFKAKIENDKMLGGQFWSNYNGFDKWVGNRDETAALPPPTALTYLKEGHKTIAFSFKNAKNQTVSLSDAKYQGKVVVVQIMGSWCPNCMDESRFLAPWYNKNKKRGVEVIGLTFEKSLDSAFFAYPKMRKMIQRFGINYEVLLAGTNDANAGRALPMLNKIAGYPSTIFIDKKGLVREIHTGFSGPGTGKYYDEFVEDFNRLIDKLVAE